MENIRAAVVLTALGVASYLVLRPLLVQVTSRRESETIRNLFIMWVMLIGIFSIAPLGVINILLSIPLFYFFRKHISAAPWVALIFLLFSIPNLESRVPGVFGIDSLFVVSWPLVVMLALAFVSKNQKQNNFRIDGLLLICYFTFSLIFLLLQLRSDTITESLRLILYYGLMFYLIINFVKRNGLGDYKNISIGFISIGVLLSLIAIYETYKGWLLYIPLISIVESIQFWSISPYKFRDGWLRSHVAHGSLVTGLVLSAAIISHVSIYHLVKKKTYWFAIAFLLLFGVISTQARMPLLAMFIMLAAYFIFQKRVGSIKTIFYLLVPVYFVFDQLKIFDASLKILGLNDDFNVQYRIRLLSESVDLILNNMLIPNQYYASILGSRGLIQGEGIVDIVNTYLQIGLNYGGVALMIFVVLLYFSGLKFIRHIELNRRIDDKQNIFAIALFVIYLGFSLQLASVSTLGFTAAFVFFQILLLSLGAKNLKISDEGSDR